MKSSVVALLALAAIVAGAPAARPLRRQCAPAPPMTTPAPPMTTPPVTDTPPSTEPPVTPPAPPPAGGGSSGAIFSVYADVGIDADKWPSAADLGDWNDLVLSFFLTDGRNAFDIAGVWESLDEAKKDAIVKDYHSAGKTIRVSLFGATDAPLKHNGDPVAIAQQVAKWIKDNKVDGVDVDYEDSESFNAAGDGENFLIALTKELRKQLPAPYIISQAPQSPYFTTAGFYPQGAYNKVHSEVGDLIDFYNVQFYNQGKGMYETCDSLFNGGAGTIAGTSVNEIIAGGVPASKVVVGKPGGPTEASNGYMSEQTLGDCVRQAKTKPAGVMAWQWNSAKASWIATARGDL